MHCLDGWEATPVGCATCNQEDQCYCGEILECWRASACADLAACPVECRDTPGGGSALSLAEATWRALCDEAAGVGGAGGALPAGGGAAGAGAAPVDCVRLLTINGDDLLALMPCGDPPSFCMNGSLSFDAPALALGLLTVDAYSAGNVAPNDPATWPELVCAAQAFRVAPGTAELGGGRVAFELGARDAGPLELVARGVDAGGDSDVMLRSLELWECGP
jgi:hypothetical protein